MVHVSDVLWCLVRCELLEFSASFHSVLESIRFQSMAESNHWNWMIKWIFVLHYLISSVTDWVWSLVTLPSSSWTLRLSPAAAFTSELSKLSSSTILKTGWELVESKIFVTLYSDLTASGFNPAFLLHFRLYCSTSVSSGISPMAPLWFWWC